jgi:hypothetical protein
MDDQHAPSPVSRRIFLGGGVVALTAAAAAPLAFNYASRGHGDWWPDHVAHAESADDPGRHYHYVRDQLVVAQDDLGELRRALGRRVGVEATVSLDELGLALVQLHGARGGVPELVDGLHHGRDRAALWAAPNYVLGPCTHLHISGSIPQPTTESLAPFAAGAGPTAGAGSRSRSWTAAPRSATPGSRAGSTATWKGPSWTPAAGCTATPAMAPSLPA